MSQMIFFRSPRPTFSETHERILYSSLSFSGHWPFGKRIVHNHVGSVWFRSPQARYGDHGSSPDGQYGLRIQHFRLIYSGPDRLYDKDVRLACY